MRMFPATTLLLATVAAHAAPPGTLLAEYAVSGVYPAPPNPTYQYDHHPDAYAYHADMAASAAQYASGAVITAWRPPNQNVVLGRRIEAHAAPLAAEFRINASTPPGAAIGAPVVAVAPSKRGVAAWPTYDSATGEFSVYLRALRPSDGRPVGSDILAATMSVDYPEESSFPGVVLTVAVNDDGAMAVAWGCRSFNDCNPSFVESGIRFFNPDGMPAQLSTTEALTATLQQAHVLVEDQFYGSEPLHEEVAAHRLGVVRNPVLSWWKDRYILSDVRGNAPAFDTTRISTQAYNVRGAAVGERWEHAENDYEEPSFNCGAPMPAGRMAIAWFDWLFNDPTVVRLETFEADRTTRASRPMAAWVQDLKHHWSCRQLFADSRYGNLVMRFDITHLEHANGGAWLQYFNTTAKPISSPVRVPWHSYVAGGEATDETVTLVYPRIIGDPSQPHQVQVVVRRYAGPRSE